MKIERALQDPDQEDPVRMVACDLGPESAHVMVDRSLIEQDGRRHVS